jgi:carboxyl-terminal processing protease
VALVLLLSGSGAVATALAKSAAAQSGPAAAQTTAGEAQPLQEAWDLLMDRYALPLGPGELSQAAQRSMEETLEEAGVERIAPGLGVVGNERGQQLTGLRQRFISLASRYGDVVPPTELAYAAIRGMAKLTDDSHTNFMTPEQYQEHVRWTRGDVSYGGIGARMRGPEPTVLEVFRGSPAEQGGLHAGDVIVAVDDQSVADMRLDDVINLIRGPEGTAVTLGVRRAGGEAIDRLELVRAQVAMPFVDSRRLPGDIGYVQLRGFPEPSVVAGVENAITDLQRDGVRGIVFDLRGNGGGRLDVGSRLLARFVPDGPIYQSVSRQGQEETVNVQNAHPILTVPLAVLVDEGTASMGEVFAAAVQEHHVGRLIGTTTAGAVAASVFVPLSDGSALQLSVERVYSGDGTLLDHVGVKPDDEVELDLDALRQGHDVQMDRAVQFLQQAAATRAPATVGSTR